jgi:hypothetical protein
MLNEEERKQGKIELLAKVCANLLSFSGSEDLTKDNIVFPLENEYLDFGEESEEYNVSFLYDQTKSAEYQGRKVTLNKPFRTPDGPKKFAVYTKNDKGKVVIVRFGSKEMSIKRDDPKRRKSFRARHGCDKDPGPKWKSKYWSCFQWRANSPVKD